MPHHVAGAGDLRPLPLSYVVPLRRWAPGDDLPELAAYLADLPVDDVVVVDGSAPALAALHARLLGPAARHLAVDPAPRALNGKVAGVLTGLSVARNDEVVVADDDVRWDRAGLETVLELLAGADLVRPQNHFDPAPWHARWDTGRSLLNRVLGGDHPGTMGVRRGAVLRVGGYDGDVLFENLELVRTVRAAGGRVVDARSLYVARRPPTTRHFLGQRVRQAYDSRAQPARRAAELSLLPATLALAGRVGWPGPAGVAAAAVALAEVGRRRHEGADRFPATAALWAPLWLAERSVCAWLAVVAQARGGARYAGTRLPRAATPSRVLRRRLADRPLARSRPAAAGSGVATGAVGNSGPR